MEWQLILTLFGSFAVLLAIGVPVSFAIGLSSLATILMGLPLEPAIAVVAQRMAAGLDNFALLAIPFFILAGNIMNQGGIALRLINFAKVLGGRLPGSLAHVNYDENFSAAVNITSCPSGLLIPPSNTLIVFSLVSGGTSIAALFLAGYIPGILMGLSIMVVAGIIAKRRGSVVYTFVLAVLVYREVKWRDLPKIILESAVTTSIVLLLVGASMGMSWAMANADIPYMIADALLAISDNPMMILLIINIILLIVGIFMDMTPAVLIFTPIFLPIALDMGIDPVHFGIMMTFNLAIGICTPPVGSALFIGCCHSTLH